MTMRQIKFFLLACVLVFNPLFVSRARCADVISSVTIIDPRGSYALLEAIPEKRVYDVAGRLLNRSTALLLKVFPANADRTNPDNVVFTQSMTSDDSGRYSVITFTGMHNGLYDLTVKGYSHLTRLMSGVDFSNPSLQLDFTSSSANPLLCGDINSETGDDKINALDISVLVNRWGQDNTKADLNQDEEVNALDISNLLANFNKVGD